jgi:carbamoyl-phosphate synthase large subunit
MGIDATFPLAFYKAQLGAGTKLPQTGRAFISVRDVDKPAALGVARSLHELGFTIVATHATARYLSEHGVPAEGVNKVKEGSPHCVDAINSGDIAFVLNTTVGAQSILDSYSIRRSALQKNVPYFTTIAAARAAAQAILALTSSRLGARSLQEYHR